MKADLPPSTLARPVLVADDMPAVRSIIRCMLEDLGFTQIEEAEDGEQALELVRAKVETGGGYVMVLTDWLMPGLEGVELVRELRAETATRRLPVLMITSQGQRDQWAEALSAGVTGFVVKPFDEKQLAGEVLRILQASAPSPEPISEFRADR